MRLILALSTIFGAMIAAFQNCSRGGFESKTIESTSRLSNARLNGLPTVPATFFGGHEHRLLSKGNPWPTSRDGGATIGSIRTHDMENLNGWFQLEPRRGRYDWTSLDALFRYAAANRAEITYTFSWTPSWAIGSAKCDNAIYDGAGCSTPPADLVYWDEFVKALAEHGKGKIKSYEIWNEPNLETFWTGDMATLVEMTKHAYAIIKAVDPEALVITPSPTIGRCTRGTYEPPACWMTDFLKAGGGSHADVIGFHGYVGAKPQAEKIVAMIGDMTAVMNRFGQNSKPLWDTESSYCEDPVADRVAFLARFEILHLFSKVSRHYWYSWDSTTCGTLWSPTSGLAETGVAWAQIYDWFVGAALEGSSCQTSGSIYSCSFVSKAGSNARVVWSTSGTSDYPVPDGFSHVVDLSGTRRTLSGNLLPLGERPVLLAK